MEINFKLLKAKTQPGEEVFVTGNLEELGSWKVSVYAPFNIFVSTENLHPIKHYSRSVSPVDHDLPSCH